MHWLQPTLEWWRELNFIYPSCKISHHVAYKLFKHEVCLSCFIDIKMSASVNTTRDHGSKRVGSLSLLHIICFGVDWHYVLWLYLVWGVGPYARKVIAISEGDRYCISIRGLWSYHTSHHHFLILWFFSLNVLMWVNQRLQVDINTRARLTPMLCFRTKW